MSVEANEMRSIVIRAKVSEVGVDRVVIHPNDDPSQSITIPMKDILAFGDKSCEKIQNAA